MDSVTKNPMSGPNTPRRNAPCPCGSGKKFKKCGWERGEGNGFSLVAVPKDGGPRPKTLKAQAPLSPDEGFREDF
jgi:hypothetical protein